MRQTLLRYLCVIALLNFLSVYTYAYSYYFYDNASGMYYLITSESAKTVSVSYGRGGNVSIPSTVTLTNKGHHWYGPSGDHGADELAWFWTDYGSTYTVTEIRDGAFEYMDDLYSVSIPPTVKYIGSYAFYGCSALLEVVIPQSVTQIGFNAFYGCDNLKSVTSKSYTPPYMDNEWCFSEKAYNNSALYVHYPSMGLYGKADWWKNFWIFEELATDFHEGFDDSFGSTKPIGVTADGASKMYVYFDRNDIKDIKSWEIKTLIDSVQINDTTKTGVFGEFKKLENGKFGFDYRAPEDFPSEYNNKNSYEVRLEVRAIDVDGDSLKGKTDITVMRTGVLLIHGLWGNTDCFSGLMGYLQNEAGYMPYQIKNCDYKATHGESFVNNTFIYAVVDGCMKDLFHDLAKAGIISSKYDLVGHSMGGILSRMYAQEVNSKAVNRIITLDTPHSGSQLADHREAVLSALSMWSASLNPTVVAVTSFAYHMLTQPAITDLKTTSLAIKRLNDPALMANAREIPVHAISSCVKEWEQESEEPSVFRPINLEAIGSVAFHNVLLGYENALRGANTYGFLQWIFNGDNDGVVSCVSQMGGVPDNSLTTQYDSYKGLFGLDSWAHHIKTNKWSKTYENIKQLLKASKYSSLFSTDGFNPIDLSLSSAANRIPKDLVLKDAPESSYIHLNVERVDSLRALDVKVLASDDVESYIAYAFIGDNKMIFSNDQPESRFLIPDDFEGQLNIFALGRTVNDELVANMDSTYYLRAYPIYSLFFEDQADKIMTIGQSLTFNVMTNWWNGYDYVTPVLTSNKSGIIEINNQIVTAINSGECKLIAYYEGFTDSINIIVASQDETLPGDVNNDGEVNIADINAIIVIILGGDADNQIIERADVNGDEEINIADINAIIDIILGD